MAAIYGRDADREAAQRAILTAAQKRFTNIDWKPRPPRLETAHKSGARKTPK